MDLHLIIAAGILIWAVTGFVFLAIVMVTSSESVGERKVAKRGDFFVRFDSGHPLKREKCYEQCMEDSKWDPAQVPTCISAC